MYRGESRPGHYHINAGTRRARLKVMREQLQIGDEVLGGDVIKVIHGTHKSQWRWRPLSSLADKAVLTTSDRAHTFADSRLRGAEMIAAERSVTKRSPTA